RLGAQVALLQSPILPAAGSLYPVKEIFCNVPVDKPHTRISRFELPPYDSGVFALSPAGRLSPFLRQTCLFLFFCESQLSVHQYIVTSIFLRRAILRSSAFSL
ncbi:MAG: hypothetical protein NTW03_19460, partial [Verrucomicrobia bacterium]|nr:hypothetical protein [Verrucomicrobiota bacterium]